MDINLLVVSVGNSRLAVGTFVAGQLESVKRISHENQAEWAGALTEAWRLIADAEDATVAGASVNPPLTDAVEHAVSEATGRNVKWVGGDIALPMKVLTDKPDQTGVDRILNLAAAYEQMGKACVVVDAGTAVTIDCCNDAGEFLGGAIAPGVSLQLGALREKTAKLPDVKFDVPAGAFGKSTEDAMRQGVYHGIRGTVRELVEQYATELGNWPDIIATGGDAAKLFQGWELIHAVSPDLIFYGIALAYVNHEARR